MDDYITLGTSLLNPDYSIVSSPKNIRVLPNVLILETNILRECPTPHELKENMSKRLVVPDKSRGGPNLAVVAMMCLASKDYSVSHLSICGLTEKNIVKIWGYLERQTVSSSYQLRQWMRSRIGTRTCEGYMAHWNISRSVGASTNNDVVVHGSWDRCIIVTDDMANKVTGQPTTILEAASYDICTSSKVKSLLGL